METATRSDSLRVTVGRYTSQAMIEGNIPILDGRACARLVGTTAEISISDTHITDGKLMIEGKVVFTLLCEDDTLYVFYSTADFRHSIECAEAAPGMSAAVQADIISLSSTLNGSQETITVNGVVDVICRVEQTYSLTSSAKCAQQLSTDAQVKAVRMEYIHKRNIGCETKRVREEIIATDVADIIETGAKAIIRDITITSDTARVDGILAVAMLCVNAEGAIIGITQNLPFVSDVEISGAGSENICGNINVITVSARTVGEEYGVVSVDATVEISINEECPESSEIISDAYSINEPFICDYESAQFVLYRGEVEQRTQMHESVSAPMKVSRAVTAYARAVVNSAERTDSGVKVEGITYIDTLYLDDAGILRTVAAESPFSVGMGGMSYKQVELDVSAKCVNITAQAASENRLEISYNMYLKAAVYELADTSVICAVRDGERADVIADKGVTVVFAHEGDTMFDIAKRVSVERGALGALNPDLKEPLRVGDAVLVMR